MDGAAAALERGEGGAVLRDLALISDRRTAALVTRRGEIVWYCPPRFDAPSLLGRLLDNERGGSWRFEAERLAAGTRRYLGGSGVLETALTIGGESLQVTDFLPFGPQLPRGLCRRMSASPAAYRLVLHAAPDYARQPGSPRALSEWLVSGNGYALHASHPLTVEGERVILTVPAGESAWAALLGEPASQPHLDEDVMASWQSVTLAAWDEVNRDATYHGPYQDAVRDSLRVLRMLTDHDSGSTVAAPTTSLPEVAGGALNWDYRYVWLRDAGMVVSALTRLETGPENQPDTGLDTSAARRFLAFICGQPLRGDGLPLAPFTTTTGGEPPPEVEISLAGYAGSRPVRVGNGASGQLQLDAYSNVLLAAKLIYERFDTREHWSVVSRLADFLAEHWHEDDYGVWEERQQRPYVTGKVLTACALDALAALTSDAAQRERWQKAAAAARQWVTQHGLTREGAYAYVAGGEGVDVSAALYPVWGYCPPDSPEMLATMRVLERDSCREDLYWRHLENAPDPPEGAFLAGTFWVAQYWVLRDTARARVILDAALRFASDLGQLPEEADVAGGKLLGNFPQTFVHAALIGTVIDLRTVEAEH